MAGERLRISEGKERGKVLGVEVDLPIGRASAQEEGRLGEDPLLSRRHARISRGPGGALTIEDLGSANGTFVNDERVDAPRTLDLGDVIKVGRTVLEVTDPSGQVPEPTQLGAASPGTVVVEPREQLLVTAGAAKGRRFSVADEFLIGRAVSGEGRLDDDPELSRRHASFARGADGRLTIEDLGSANGTFVNDEPVRERRALRVGDTVRVGTTTLQVTVSGQAAATSAPESPPPPAAEPPPPPPPAPAPPPAPVAADIPLGSVVAGCRIEEVIGRGDMGVVYRAEELALQRQVALKLILPEHSREERFRERFRRESMVAASIDHPNVIPILEAGDEDGLLFITMRLVDGTDLRALIAEQGRVDPLRVARIVRQVGAGLDAAHKRGLVHRDVKPANVLLARADHVYLSDFGLAKRTASVGGMTRQGSILARAEYAAPEQIKNDRVDARTDIYALGCLLFEALTGEAPFATWKEGPAMMAHLDAPRPSPVALCPGLPAKFDEVVSRAMAVEPDQRYQSAGDVGEAALVAAGELRRAGPESVVASGEAAPPAVRRGARPSEAEADIETEARAPAGRDDTLRWGFALAVLVLLAVGMVAALSAISNL